MTTPNIIQIDNVEYVRKDQVDQSHYPATNVSGLKYVIIRSRDSGVHAGYLQASYRDESTVDLVNARRIYYWSGAATLSELAMKGVGNPDDCKFPCVVPEITVLGICEIIPTTDKARQSIEEVPVWTAQ